MTSVITQLSNSLSITFLPIEILMNQLFFLVQVTQKQHKEATEKLQAFPSAYINTLFVQEISYYTFLPPLHIKHTFSSLNALWRVLKTVLRMIICTPVFPPEPATGRVIEAEGNPVSGDVCSGHRGTGLRTVHMMDQAPLATVADG